MKRLILFATIAILSMGYAFAQKNAKSAVTFDSYEWDFGNIDAANGAVCHTFTFKNNSKKAVKFYLCYSININKYFQYKYAGFILYT